jgi:hypothetical protein
MNKIQKILTVPTVVALLSAAGSLSAAPIVLDFEGLQNFEPINDYYNGGTGGNGTGGGPNYGVSFTSDSLALISATAGGTGQFTGSLAPSPNSIAFFLTGAGDTMNVAGGFTTGFSFFYTSPFFAGSVTVWSGLNGTGSLLGTLNLGLTPDTSGTTGFAYDGWAASGVAFSGTAESAVFSGVADYIGFDDITLGSQTPGDGRVPDGGTSALLLGMGLMSLVGFSSRRLAMAKSK